MEINKIYNEDCFLTLDRMDEKSIDLILTSPPYNISRVGDKDPYDNRYDYYEDGKTNEEYLSWTIELFNKFDRVLKKDRVVLYNMSYSGENSDLLWLVVADIIRQTNFTTADCIVWKKSNAIPNNISKNKLTRICEFVFVFVRKSDFLTFDTNKQVVNNIARTGQNIYENIFAFIEAKNNDGSNDLNKATFSTEFVNKLLDIYAKDDYLVYDPFMGTGTTANACLKRDLKYIGSELSPNQVLYANDRLQKVKNKKAQSLF